MSLCLCVCAQFFVCMCMGIHVCIGNTIILKLETLILEQINGYLAFGHGLLISISLIFSNGKYFIK